MVNIKNIVVCNQKGGVGKSLIADEIAFSFDRTKTPYNFYDMDSQGGILHKTNKMENAEISVIDTPGALQKALSDWIQAADVIVIPTRTTSRDIEPLFRMINAVKSNSKIAPIYVLNCWNRFKASKDFLDWFKKQEEHAKIVKLPQSEAFVQAAANGISVVEYAKRGKPVRATLELVNTVREQIGIEKEEI